MTGHKLNFLSYANALHTIHHGNQLPCFMLQGFKIMTL